VSLEIESEWVAKVCKKNTKPRPDDVNAKEKCSSNTALFSSPGTQIAKLDN